MAVVDERPLTSGAVAKLLGVSQETVVSYAEKGLLRGFQLPFGHWRFTPEAVEDLKRAQAAS